MGCPEATQDVTHVKENDLKEPLIEINKNLVEIENDQIDGYIKRRKWDVIRTGTGLRYKIYEHGTGDSAVAERRARVEHPGRIFDETVKSLSCGSPWGWAQRGPKGA